MRLQIKNLTDLELKDTTQQMMSPKKILPVTRDYVKEKN